MIERFTQGVIKWRWLVVLASIVFFVVSMGGYKNFAFDSDYRVFFGEDNPQLLAFEKMQNVYSKNDNVVYVIEPVNGKGVFQPDVIKAIAELTEASWQTPYASRVDSITNYQHTYAEEDDMIVIDLVEDPENASAEDLEYAKQVALNEPLLRNRLISESGHVTGVNVTIQLPGVDQTQEVPEVVGFVRDLAEKVETKYPGVKLHITGMVMFNNAFSESAQNDVVTLLIPMVLFVIIFTGVLLRTVAGTVGTMAIIIISALSCVGIALYTGLKMTGPSMSAFTMVMTLAVADSVHILSSIMHHMRHGMSKNEAIVESLRINHMPVMLTSLTTAVGFLTLNFSDAPPFAHLGNIVAVGVMVAYVLSITLLPAIMAISPLKVKQVSDDTSSITKVIGNFIVAKKTPVLWGSLAVMIAVAAAFPMNELNDEFVEYFSKSTEFRKQTDYAADNLIGLTLIDYDMRAKDTGGVADPEYLENLEKFANWYRSQPEVTHVNVVTDIFKRLNKNMHADDQAYYKLPESRELAAQYLLLYEMSLPYGLDLNNQINTDKSGTRMTVTLVSMKSTDIIAMDAKAVAWMKENLPEYMHTIGGSPSVMFAHIGMRNIYSMLGGAITALVLISALLIFALRSLKYGLISLIPNLMPAAIGFGIWGMFVGEVGLALSVVISMTLGIIVDDTIHFLSKYIRAKKEKGLDAEAAVRYAFNSVGMALIITTAVLAIGFIILAQSTFRPNAWMGALTAITIVVALIVDFTFLPAFLMKLEGKKDEEVVADTSADVASA